MEASNIWNWINPSNFSKMEISIVAGAGLFAAATLLYKNWDKILAKGNLYFWFLNILVNLNKPDRYKACVDAGFDISKTLIIVEKQYSLFPKRTGKHDKGF